MAKKKNKGFSLIEVVIAVAVLGLLITPILTQIVQTSNTSRKAKERQAAVENAEYITNFFQRTDKSELDKASSDGVSDISITSMDTYRRLSDENDTRVSCELVDETGTSLKTVKYNATVYTLNDVKLGPKSNEYTRTVLLDDLNSIVLASGYSIIYDGSKYNNALQSDGYVLTNEGSIVKYNSYGAVTHVVCKERDVAYADQYVNPNDINLGFIQDLDSTKVAIIQATASNFDAQVTDDIFAQKMDRLRELNEKVWKDQASQTDNKTIFSDDVNGVRLLYVTIKAVKKPNNDIDYYEVKCDACYYDKFVVSDLKGNTSPAMTAKLKYNVFAKRFYTTKSPDIYLVYEPYVSDTSGKYYSYNDYIELYNDKDTEESKLYLIQPSESQLSISHDGKYTKNHHYLTEVGGVERPVNINFSYAYGSDKTVKPIHTYTNLDVNYKSGSWDQFSFDNTVRNDSESTYNFDTENLTELRKMPWTTSVEAEIGVYPKENLHSLSDDTNYSDRLFTITVTLKSKDGKMDDVRYSAGKGVD